VGAAAAALGAASLDGFFPHAASSSGASASA